MIEKSSKLSVHRVRPPKKQGKGPNEVNLIEKSASRNTPREIQQPSMSITITFK